MDSEEREDDGVARRGWARWYREAREEMAFRYGKRGVPVDAYKIQYALARTVQQACKVIMEGRF